ncbi:MAG: response regulator [Gammaproteobacteria bacterium]|nr:response regulator [Gammaproteobacteria bacterium]
MTVAAGDTKSVLIVDDDASLRQMLCWAFEDKGYYTWGAGDSASAIDAVRGLSFSFALIDYHLPDGDGLTLMQLLKSHAPRLRLVLMSGDPSTVAAALGGRNAAVTFFEKPVPVLKIDRLFLGKTQA